jgi:KUP system potassium uptake protein
VLPALVINYFGQGALVLANPKALENPFFLLYPEWSRLPMVFLATLATVIASQAVITGAYSLTQQAIQLGLLPRLAIRHTSASLLGQIYMPRVNWMLLGGVLLLVGLFRTSSAIASAYGIAVSTTMLVDGLLAFLVIWKLWNWRLAAAAALMVPFIVVDTTFFVANLIKILEGAWVPLLFGALMIAIMVAWRRGTNILIQKTRRIEVPFEPLARSLEKKPPHIVPGTAVFLTSDPQFAPTALLHNLKHNKVLHEHNVVLTIVTADTPRVPEADRVQILQSSPHFMRVVLTFGYMESPNVPKALAIARRLGWAFDIMSTSFFLSRRSLRPEAHAGLPRLQDRLFIALARSADDATSYFQIPSERVVEIGTQVTV